MDENSLFAFMQEKLAKKKGQINTSSNQDFVLLNSSNQDVKTSSIPMRSEALPKPPKTFLRQSLNSKPKIQKIPSVLKQSGNYKFFKPKEFSFGPIHSAGYQYQEAQTTKLVWGDKLIKNSGQTPEVLFNRITQDIDKLRGCFQDDVITNQDDVKLALTLLVDGCALLYYIKSIADDEFECLNIKPYQAAFLDHDMLLLENQLPFQLLVLLVDAVNQDRKSWIKNIEKFLLGIPLMSNAGVRADQEEKKVTKENAGVSQQQNEDLIINVDREEEMPTHLLELLRKRLFRLLPATEQPQKEQSRKSSMGKEEFVWESYRSVIELKAAGINVKKKQSKFLNDIDFHDHWICGSLYVPAVAIYDLADSLFMNLIAYEMCPDFDNDLEVTSYICFLDMLIDHPEDVKELRKAHIVRNFLGSDEELAKLFNTIGKELVSNYRLYASIKKDIQKYYDSNWRTNFAEFHYNHFTSPWSMIAFVVAIIIFGLAIVQTIFTVNPPK